MVEAPYPVRFGARALAPGTTVRLATATSSSRSPGSRRRSRKPASLSSTRTVATGPPPRVSVGDAGGELELVAEDGDGFVVGVLVVALPGPHPDPPQRAVRGGVGLDEGQHRGGDTGGGRVGVFDRLGRSGRDPHIDRDEGGFTDEHPG